jgi:glycosyltransferase involved in cell wall biosynthesis
MNSPAVSVVIPLYNKVSHIRRALDSVLAQTYQDFEVIVVNDGSTDGSEKVLERYADPRIRLVNQANAGVSAARNRGTAEARADLIAFLDADDEWYDCHLANIDVLARSFPEAGLFTSLYEVLLDDGTVSRPDCPHVPRDSDYVVIPDYFETALGREYPFNASCIAAPRRVLAEVGGFPEDIHVGEDLSLVMKVALKHVIAFTWIPGAKYRKDAAGRVTRESRLLATRVKNSASLADYRYLRSCRVLEDGEPLTDYINKRLLHDAIRLYQICADRKQALQHLDLVTSRMYRRQANRWKLVVHVPLPLFRIALRLRFGKPLPARTR